MKVTVVIPTYNEKGNISELIPKVFRTFDKLAVEGDVIVVDDNSPDGTAGTVRDISTDYDITLIERPKKMGLGSAYVCGFKEALSNGADIIFEMDADLSHDPEKIGEFLDKLGEGYDVVVGSRRVDGGSVVGWGITRKAVSFTGNLIGKIITGIKVSDITSGYRGYRREVLETINLDNIKSTSYDFQLEILYRSVKNNFKIGTVPITFHDRRTGKSKLSKKDMVNFALTAINLRLKGH